MGGAANGACLRCTADLLQSDSHQHRAADSGLKSGVIPHFGFNLARRPLLLRNIAYADRPVVGASVYQPCDDLLELTHIARVVPLQQVVANHRIERQNFLTWMHLPHEMLSKWYHVLRAFAQRR